MPLVTGEQKLHHSLLRLDGQIGMGEHLHAVGHRRCARGQGLRRLLHLHQTHAAVGGNRKFLVVAKMRDIDTHLLRGVHHRAAVGYLRFLAVDLDF